MAPKVMNSENDPMLQDTYLQDDSKDFLPSSAALDEFEARLASGQPAHSAPSMKKQSIPARSVPIANRTQQKKQQQKGLNGLVQPQHTGQVMTEEELERLEEIEAVRRLGNDSDGDDD